MKDGVLMRVFHCLETHWKRFRDFTGRRLRMLRVISWGRKPSVGMLVMGVGSEEVGVSESILEIVESGCWMMIHM